MLLSLIIPTRERSHFLQESLKTAIAVKDADVEIIVSDNASQDDTREIVERCRDPRVTYLNTGRRVSMRQNFEFALEHSSGDYVIYIGDDDGFLPRQIPWLQQVLERDHPEVFAWQPLRFGWPISGFGKRTGGVRFQRKNVYGAPQRVDLSRHAKFLRHAQIQNIECTPNVYHGCASRQYLESIKRQSGAFFGGRIPDVYFSYYATLGNASFLYAAHPFTINAYSPVSIGNAHAYRSSDRRIKPATRFGDEASTDPVQDVVPGYVPTIPLNLYSTYETVCAHLGYDVSRTEREDWYRYVLEKTSKSDIDTYQSVAEVLGTYARATDTESELCAAASLAQNGRVVKGNEVRRLLRRIWSQAQSAKFSAARNGSNTVFTASQLADDLLAADYQAALTGRLRSPTLWARLLARGLKRSLSRTESGPPCESEIGDMPSTDEATRAA